MEELKSGGIFFQNAVAPFSEIISKNYPTSQFHSYQKSIIDFIQEWLKGSDEFILHTSGSTGKPKAIKILREQMEASAFATDSALNLSEMNTALLCLNPEFIGGKMMLVRAMLFNWELVVVPPQANPFHFLQKENFYSKALDFLALTPYQMKVILQSPEREILQNYKSMILGGAPVDWALRQELQSIQVPTYATYGMTETVSHIALQSLNGVNQSDAFQILSGVEIRQDERNCLEIKAPVTLNKWITTNDIVEIFDNQHFRWLGRADNVVNSGGIKIQIEEVEKLIEQAFYKLNISNRFLVGGIPHPSLGEALVLIVEGEATFSQEKLFQFISHKLGNYKTPKKIFYTHQMIETATGKIHRQNNLEEVQNPFMI